MGGARGEVLKFTISISITLPPIFLNVGFTLMYSFSYVMSFTFGNLLRTMYAFAKTYNPI